MAAYWLFSVAWLRSLCRIAGRNEKAGTSIAGFGIAGAIYLIGYVTFLGTQEFVTGLPVPMHRRICHRRRGKHRNRMIQFFRHADVHAQTAGRVSRILSANTDIRLRAAIDAIALPVFKIQQRDRFALPDIIGIQCQRYFIATLVKQSNVMNVKAQVTE